MVFTVCIVLYDLTLRLVLAAMDGVVAPALCGRPRRNSTGCSTSHKFGRTFVIALVFEQNSGHSPILPLATWFDRHEELSWELVSSQQSEFNPFQSISMSRSNQRSFPLTFLCSGGERPDQSTRNQCVSHTVMQCILWAGNMQFARQVKYIEKQFYGAEGIEEGVKHSSASQWHETITSVSHCLVLYI